MGGGIRRERLPVSVWGERGDKEGAFTCEFVGWEGG